MSPSWIAPLVGSEWALVLGLVVKSSVLLGLGAAVAAFGRSAAERHLVWTFTLAGCLLLAFFTPLAPALPVTVGHEQPHEGLSIPSRPAASEAVAQTSNASRLEERLSANEASSRFVPWGRGPTTMSKLALVWSLGCAAMLVWCLLGHLGLAGISRSASPLQGREWPALLDGSLARQGVARRVRLARSGAVGAPVTWGWIRPLIVVPNEAETWPEPRRRIVVVHEVAHVARHDYVMHLVASIALAVFWFHPLAWLAVRRMRIESEHACDDRVLADGTAASEYATHLLEVARRARRLRVGGMVAVSMARSSHLGRRIVAILDETRLRRAVSLRDRLLLAGVLGLLLIPYTALRPVLGAAVPAVNRAPVATRTEPAIATGESDEQALAHEEAARPEVNEAVSTDEDSRSDGKPDANFAANQASDGDANGEGAASVDRTVASKSGEDLDLDLESGGEVVIRAWDQPRVHVRARLAGQDWRDTRVTVERTMGGVRVRSHQEVQRQNSSTSHVFDVQVPRKFNVRLHSAGGGLSITGVEGEFRGNTGGGELKLDHVRGYATLSTGGGQIEVTDSDLGGTVSTGGGEVRLSRVTGGLRGSSGSGPVIYAKDEAEGNEDNGTGDLDGVTTRGTHIDIDKSKNLSRGALHIEQAGGDVSLDEAPEGAWISTGGGDINVGRAAGHIVANTGGGDIAIGPVAGSVTAGTGAGEVHVTLSPGQREQTVELESGSGRVIVDLPANFDGRFELETAYTRGKSPTRIECPWQLEREATNDWDSHEGTPRKYVRAHGIAGSGKGLARIHTVNGDIVVRRGK